MVKLVINSVCIAPGGGLTNLLGLLEGWRSIDADLDVTVLASRPQTIEALESAGFGSKIHRVPLMPLHKRLLWERFAMPRLVKRLGADLLLTNTYLCPGSPVPQVVHHQNLFTCFAAGYRAYWKLGVRFLLLSLGARKALRNANANIFISNHVRKCSEELVPQSKPRNSTVYYGLSAHFTAPDRSKDAPRDRYRLCAMQAPCDYKENDTLLEAFAELIQIAPQAPWKLDIAGWGDFSPWQRKAEALGIADRVRWLGHRNTQQIAQMLRESGCMLYPSTFEGFGLPLIEAMASGCPAIAVNSTALPEIAADAAVLVPARSAKALAAATLRVCTDTKFRLQLVSNGLERARRFSWASTSRQFCNVFARLLRKPVATSAPERDLLPALSLADVGAV